MPFGSVIERARLPLIAVPFALCIVAALLRLYATRERNSTAQPTQAWIVWGIGALLFLAVCALQLVPLTPGLLRRASAESHAIWNGASQIAALTRVTPRRAWPLTIDPQITLAELLRMVALFATFTTSALLVRTEDRRRTLAIVLCLAGVFESLYGLREAALQRYEIWGWVNRLVFDRVTGTFVNPNHFAHYVALVVPMTLFLGAILWRRSGRSDARFGPRFASLLERHALMAGFTALAGIVCVAGILLSQSRGALLALGAAILVVAAMMPGRRVMRIIAGSLAGLILIAALAIFLGPSRTIARFSPSALGQQSVSRGQATLTAIAIWKRFPLLGSGLGTFESVVSIEQDHDLEGIYHHAHNDYLELAATAGSVGFLVALGTLAGGTFWLVRQTFGEPSKEITFRRRAFQAAALVSLCVALVHALFDFNFYIPSNPATLATILGAAVASVDHDRRKSHNRSSVE
jgi:O-antigen ligase